MRQYFDALFPIQIYLYPKFCPLLERVGLRLVAQHITDFLRQISGLLVKIVLPLDALQPIMMSVGMLTYLKPNFFC